MNEKAMELKGIVVDVKGNKVNLGELTYEEFTNLMESLTDDEAREVLEQIIEKIGGEAFMMFLAKIEEMSEEDEELEGGLEVDSPKEEKSDDKQKPLPPVKFVNMDDFFSYDPELVVAGIDSVSHTVGQYLAFVNAGMPHTDAFKLITVQADREHELKTLEKQIELRKLESELQMKLSGVKQLLNR